MNFYQVWFDLKDSVRHKEFLKSARDFLDLLKIRGLITEYVILRRKLGLGPEELGEFNIQIMGQSIGALDRISELITKGDSDLYLKHAEMVKFGLYRKWPL